jgi:hypothetical protein
MLEPRVLEGAWEEIKVHDEELAGRIVRVEVLQGLDEKVAYGTDNRTSAEMFKGRIGKHSFEPRDLAERTEEYLAQGFGRDPGEDLDR